MKTITAAAQTILNTQKGVDIRIILKIDWASPFGTEYYGPVTTTIGTLNVQGRIGSMSDIVSAVGPDYGASTASVQVVLIDPDGNLYLKMLASAVEQAPVTIYAHVAGTGEADLIELLRGEMGSPIAHTDAVREFGFDIVSPIRSTPATYTLDQDLDSSVPDESDGAVVPLCMGVPRDVPAVLYRRGPESRTIEDFDSSDTKFEIESGPTFPSGVLTLRVEGEMISATVANDEVTVAGAAGRNVAKYAGLLTANRPSNDPDKNNPFVVFCQDASKDHVGNYVIVDANDVPGVNGSPRRNFCVYQKGTKLVFERPWTGVNQGLWIVPAGVSYDVKRYAFEWINGLAVNANQWQTQAGAHVTVFKDSNGTGREEADYLVNAIPSTSVLRVRAYRTYQQGVLGLTERRLVAVPESLWTWSNVSVQVADGSGSLVSITATRIRFPVALGALNQGWDDAQVFVTLRSSVGTNIADQIKWLLENRTNVDPNNASFNAAATKLTKYRADFAILADRDALEVAHDLAFQGRSALILNGAQARLTYLSEAPTAADFQLKESNIRRDSFRFELSYVEDVKTVYRAPWRTNYTGDRERLVRRRKNVSTFGVRIEQREFWAFQRNSLVRKSADFWNRRRSRCWKLVRCEASIQALAADVLDIPSVQFPFTLLPIGVLGRVFEVRYTPKPNTLSFLVWIPHESGPNSQSSNAYLVDTGDPTIADPAPKVPKQVIARVAPFGFSMVSEPFITATPVKILNKLTSKTAEIEVYPNGFSAPASGTAFLTVIGTPDPLDFVNGGQGVAWRTPGGSYVSDVFAG